VERVISVIPRTFDSRRKTLDTQRAGGFGKKLLEIIEVKHKLILGLYRIEGHTVA
jgi:hypothetical protein